MEPEQMHVRSVALSRRIPIRRMFTYECPAAGCRSRSTVWVHATRLRRRASGIHDKALILHQDWGRSGPTSALRVVRL